jgi:DNA-binding response OmpR family regulator
MIEILLVEDEDNLRRVLRLTLENDHYTVDQALTRLNQTFVFATDLFATDLFATDLSRTDLSAAEGFTSARLAAACLGTIHSASAPPRIRESAGKVG